MSSTIDRGIRQAAETAKRNAIREVWRNEFTLFAGGAFLTLGLATSATEPKQKSASPTRPTLQSQRQITSDENTVSPSRSVLDMGSSPLTNLNSETLHKTAVEKSRGFKLITIPKNAQFSQNSAPYKLPILDEETINQLYAFGLSSFKVAIDETSQHVAAYIKFAPGVKISSKYFSEPNSFLLHTVDETGETETVGSETLYGLHPQQINDIYSVFQVGSNHIGDIPFVIQVNYGLLQIGQDAVNSFLLPAKFVLQKDPYVPGNPWWTNGSTRA